MACNCGTPNCSGQTCNPSDEPLSSALTNFITEFFGTVTKSCVNGVVVWALPCNLAQGSPFFPRLPGEGLACYFLRFFLSVTSNTGVVSGLKGFRTTALTNANLVLYRFLDFINQDFTGTLSGPVVLYLTANQAQAGDEFDLSFTSVVITAINTLAVNSDGTPLLVLSTPGTVNGYVKGIFTGTVWKLTETNITIS